MEKENVMAVFFFFPAAGKSRKACFACRDRDKRREERDKSEKMYRMLGMLIGMAIVIILM